uniref:ISL3 family transposase n=1 Tax=Streptomyces polyasparticus TaxID=2767826 RepID=UPI0034D5377F
MPVGGRRVVVHLRVRRLVCPVIGCRRQTFRERVPGLLERHQRRTVRLTAQIPQVARELCGRAAARLAGLLSMPVSRSTALRHLKRLPLPDQVVPRVIGVEDFTLRRRHRYATIITDAQTGRRVAVLPDREMATLKSWLKAHAGIEVVCRDSSASYAEAIRRALPDAVQVSDRWHLWRNLYDKVLFEVWRPVSEPGAEHRQTICPHARLPAHPCRPLPRALARTPHDGPVRAGHSPPAKDPRVGLRRQRQPPGPLPQPGQRRRRSPGDHRTPGHPAPAHPPRQSPTEGHNAAGDDCRVLPGNDRSHGPRAQLRRLVETGQGQRREAHRVDHVRPCCRTTVPAQLHQRSRNRPARRERRAQPAVPQRLNRRRQHPHQES